jgi:hypothetical protein
MKFDNNDIAILKNFATINPCMWFYKGNVVRTVSSTASVVGFAEISTNIEKDFGIYDLNQLLGVIGMLESPEIDLKKEDYILVSDKNQRFKMNYGVKKLIKPAPTSMKILKDLLFDFELSKEILNNTLNAASILQTTEIVFAGNGHDITIEALNIESKTSQKSIKNVGKTDKKFKFIFDATIFKMVPTDYHVEVRAEGEKIMCEFSSADGKLKYWIAVEANSEW